MSVLDWLLIVVAAPTLCAYVCRLSQLTFLEHRPTVVLMHICLGISVAWGGIHATTGAGMNDWTSVIGAAMWIVISYKSWRLGVPAHFLQQKRVHAPIVTK